MVKIYESPDGGETIFERDTKTGKRIMIEKPSRPEWHFDNHDLFEMQDLADRGNKAMQKSLKELKLIYNLVKGSDDY